MGAEPLQVFVAQYTSGFILITDAGILREAASCRCVLYLSAGLQYGNPQSVRV